MSTTTMDTEKYKSIRPLTPEEVPAATAQLTSLAPLPVGTN